MAMTLKKSLKLGLLAEESKKTKKAREKLKQRLQVVENKLAGKK
jgi:hypothetical protein